MIGSLAQITARRRAYERNGVIINLKNKIRYHKKKVRQFKKELKEELEKRK